MPDFLRLIFNGYYSSSLCVCGYTRRFFSTTIKFNSNSPKEKPRSSMDTQVVRLQISPFKWFRQQIILLLLKRIDPEFNIDDCTAGATKAAPVFMQALAKENWASLKRMASEQAIDDFRMLIERDAEIHRRASRSQDPPPTAPEESPWQFARQVLKFTRNEMVAAHFSLLTLAPRSVNSEDTFAGIPLEKDASQAMEVYFEYDAFFSREVPESMRPKFAELYMKKKKVFSKTFSAHLNAPKSDQQQQVPPLGGILGAVGLKSGLTMEVPLQFARLYVQRHGSREWRPASSWLVHRVPHIRIMPFILPGLQPSRDDDAE